jgi:hypothetical protein
LRVAASISAGGDDTAVTTTTAIVAAACRANSTNGNTIYRSLR